IFDRKEFSDDALQLDFLQPQHLARQHVNTLRAIIITSPGAPGALQLQDRPVSEPGTGEVLVSVHAAGINRPDVAQRKGHYPPPPGASPDIPGLEISGVG